jgi:hypothetical protein
MWFASTTWAKPFFNSIFNRGTESLNKQPQSPPPPSPRIARQKVWSFVGMKQCQISCSVFGTFRGTNNPTVTIPEAAYIQLLRRLPEDEQCNARNM